MSIAHLRRLEELRVDPKEAAEWAHSFVTIAERKKGRAHPDAASLKRWPWLAAVREERVEARVAESLPDFALVGMERVQNKALWRKYSTYCAGQEVVDERELFHYAPPEALEKILSSLDSIEQCKPMKKL